MNVAAKSRLFVIACLLILTAPAQAQQPAPGRDVFKGRLFPPNVILEHQDELGLTKDQFTAIRAAVVDVQSNIAEHEWDLREAYRRVLDGLDQTPIDEERVLADVDAAMQAENEVKRMQVGMLIRLRRLLTDEQVEYLRSVNQAGS